MMQRGYRYWVVLGLLVLIALGVLIWIWLPSSPERKARGLLVSLVDGNLQEVWTYASAEERSKTDLEAFGRVYRSIVWSQIGGWELEGPVRVQWFGDDYVLATAVVKCGNGVRFEPSVSFRVWNGKERIGIVYAFLIGVLYWYVMERDGLSYLDARKKVREEFVPLFTREGITRYFDPNEERWYGWDGSVVLDEVSVSG